MTLIKCPNCGRTVLSVASVCPRCSVPLTRERPPHTWAGTLTECRRCGHPVTTETSVCPHCSIRKPGRYVISPVALAVLAVALVSTVTLGVVVPRLADLSERLPSAPPIRAAPPLLKRLVPPVSRASSIFAASPPALADTHAADNVAQNDSGVPKDSTRATDSIPLKPSGADQPPSAPGVMPYTRWVTSMWVNVREGPADSTPVVAVLRPGQRVEAGAPTRDGWQMVYVDGRRVGYVARSLLTSQPPGR